MTINDPKAPQIGALGGSITDGGWLKGPQTVTVTGRDETGIDESAVKVDGSVVRSVSWGCDFTKAAPCASPGQDVGKTWTLAAADLPDGTHKVVGVVKDAGGTESPTSALTVKVDNTPPAAPSSLTGDGAGGGWSASSQRELSWTLPAADAGSPVTEATVTVCSVLGACTTKGADATTHTAITLPADGTWTAAVQLTDAAGNTGAPAKTEFRRDSGAPPAPGLGLPEIDPFSGEVVVPVEFAADPGPAPLAVTQAEVCAANGTGCAAVANQRVSEVRLPPADTARLLRARLVDAAGNVGAAAERLIEAPDAPVATVTPPTDPPEATVTATATPTPTPAPTVTPTDVDLRVKVVKRTRKGAKLRIVLPEAATGTVTVRVRGKARTVRLRRGVATLTVGWRHRRKLRLTVTYGGDATHAPATLAKRVKR